MKGIEQIFTTYNQKPFLLDKIDFIHVGSAQKEQNNLSIALTDKPLKIWFLPELDAKDKTSKDKKKTKHTKEDANKRIAKHLACDILDLLHSTSTQERAIDINDIAILIRKNNEAPYIQEALANHNIPYTLVSQQNIYENQVARDLYELLLAISESHKIDLIKNTLVSNLFPTDATKSLVDDPAWLEQKVFDFKSYYDNWQAYGFYPMIQKVVEANNIEQNLLNYPAGELSLNNFYHLIERISHYDFQNKCQPHELLNWYAKLIYQVEEQADEDDRIPTDLKKTVQIMTIHSSKGLEFPIVYLPFTYSGQLPEQKNLRCYHHYDESKKNIF